MNGVLGLRMVRFIQRRPNVFDVGPTLYKCYRNVFLFAGMTLSSRQGFEIPALAV